MDRKIRKERSCAMNIIKDRICLFEIENQDIAFDIQTNRIFRIDKTVNPNYAEILDAVCSAAVDCNSTALQNIGYEDGSNLALNINLTPTCNLKCTYCFAQGGNYGKLEKPMRSDIIGDIAFLIKNYQTNSRKVRFEFFGGEPLLNFQVIQEILDFSRELGKTDQVDFIHRISTNLTHLEPEMIDVMGDNNFIISISIDGPKAVQDLFRPYKNNSGSFDTIMENIKAIREKYDHLILIARMTIAQKESPLLENIKDLIGTNYFDYVSIYPASIKNEQDRTAKYQYYFDADIQRQIKEVIANYPDLFKYSSRFKGILEYEKIYDQIFNGKISISHCAAGGTYYTISGDKSVVPCHRVCGKNDFILNSKTNVLDQNIIREWTGKVDQHQVCSQCWARYICGGGCKQEHLSANGDIKTVNRNSCEYHQFILEKLIQAVSKFPASFNERNINVDDLFVYCGRPLGSNFRNRTNVERISQLNGVALITQS